MGIWIIWLIVAAVLGVAEIMTTTLAFGLLAVAALVGAGVGAAGGDAPLQFGAFVLASAAGLGDRAAVRPAPHQAAAAAAHRNRRAGRPVGLRAGRGHRAQRAGPDRRRGVVGPPLRRDPDHPGRGHRRRLADRGRHPPSFTHGSSHGTGCPSSSALVIVLLVALVTVKTVRIVPQARASNVERLGRYRKTLEPGMNVIIPFIDRVKPLIDLREQVVSFLGQPVITEDNLVVKIDTVLFFQVTDPRAADYEIVNYIQAIEQLTATMLRSVIGSMDLEVTLTSRDKINTMLRGVLDDASGKWGIRVTRVEIKAIDPPKSVIDAMEKQMRAEREKRAAILTAEGVRQAQILTADGDKQGNVLRAEGEKQSAILRAEGQAHGHRRRVPVHPRQRPDPEAARLPVPADAAADRAGPGQHGLDDPERADRRAEDAELGLRRPRGRPGCGRAERSRPGRASGVAPGPVSVAGRGAGVTGPAAGGRWLLRRTRAP